MLFGKKKEEEDNKQVNAVKENSSQESNLTNTQQNPTPSSEPINQTQSSFVNPFSTEEKTNTPLNSTPELSNQAPLENSSLASSQINMPSFTNQEERSNFNREEILEMINETVEKVIEERWESLVNNVEKISKWREKKDEELTMLKEDLVSIKESFEKLEKKLFNKINDYDRNILDVNSEIKALEKVFQKITPTLINNVNELSRIAKDFKPGSKAEALDLDEEENQTNQPTQTD